MDLDFLTQAMHDFVDSKGWTDTDSTRPQSQKNLAVSLVLEASEVLELFQWNDVCADADALEDELADVMLYLLQLASLSDIDIGDAVIKKLEKNRQREWREPSANADAPKGRQN